MDDTHPTNLTVVIGAGASYDCAGLGVTAPVNELYCPPLTKDIFAPRFNEILHRHAQVERHLDQIRTQLSQGGEFEKILRDLLESADRLQQWWPFQVPLYLRELFWTISLEYLQGSSKFHTLVQSVLDSHFQRVMFLNLNYDLFLERALVNDLFDIDEVNWYVSSSKKWLYVKPHGSVNWARILGNCPKDSAGGYQPSRLQERPVFSSELQVVLWNSQLRDFYRRQPHNFHGYWYPQVVVPADKPKDFVCPQDHINLAREFIQSCNNFLIIGFSGRDGDIVSLLQLMPNHSAVTIVSEGGAGEVLKNMHSRGPDLKAKNLKLAFDNSGFSKFIESQDFKNCLSG
ncbi:MAG: hypothetical protein ACRD2G_14615 [Terriglobia bacterium]